MVDTIVIRVHDLKRHEQLVNELNTNFKGTTKNTIYLPPEDFEMIRRNEIFDAKDYIDFWHNPKTGTHLVHFSSQKKLNNSGHYYLNAFVNFSRFCRIQFLSTKVCLWHKHPYVL